MPGALCQDHDVARDVRSQGAEWDAHDQGTGQGVRSSRLCQTRETYSFGRGGSVQKRLMGPAVTDIDAESNMRLFIYYVLTIVMLSSCTSNIRKNVSSTTYNSIYFTIDRGSENNRAFRHRMFAVLSRYTVVGRGLFLEASLDDSKYYDLVIPIDCEKSSAILSEVVRASAPVGEADSYLQSAIATAKCGVRSNDPITIELK